MANDNLIGRQESWLLTMDEIRRLRPEWPEQLVQDYFSRGQDADKIINIINNTNGLTEQMENIGTGAGWYAQKEGLTFQLKTLTTDDTIIVEESDEEIFLRVPGGGPVDDCICIEIEQPEQSCESMEEFAAQYGRSFSFLTRNYVTDLSPGGDFSGDIVTAVPSITIDDITYRGLPDGDANVLSFSLSANLLDYDTCGEDIVSWTGTSIYRYDEPSSYSNATYIMIARPFSNNNRFILHAAGSGGDDYTANYKIQWKPSTGQLEYNEGNDLDGDYFINFNVQGPVGWLSSAGVWAPIILYINRTSTSVTMICMTPDGVLHSASTSTTVSGLSLATSDWYPGTSGTERQAYFGATNAGFDARYSGNLLWTGLAGGFPYSTLRNYLYAFQRTLTGFDPETAGPPPPPDDSVLVYDPDTGLYRYEQQFPPGLPGTYLVRTGPDPADVAFLPLHEELPPGGATGDHLVKSSTDDFDVEWAQRDVKTFFNTEDPDLTETVYAGDFWVLAPPV